MIEGYPRKSSDMWHPCHIYSIYGEYLIYLVCGVLFQNSTARRTVFLTRNQFVSSLKSLLMSPDPRDLPPFMNFTQKTLTRTGECGRVEDLVFFVDYRKFALLRVEDDSRGYQGVLFHPISTE